MIEKYKLTRNDINFLKHIAENLKDDRFYLENPYQYFCLLTYKEKNLKSTGLSGIFHRFRKFKDMSVIVSETVDGREIKTLSPEILEFIQQDLEYPISYQDYLDFCERRKK